MAEQVVIAKLALEGGGATILGTQVDGRWVFWEKGTSFVINADDSEEWKSWTSEQSRDLATLLPDFWPLMFPRAVHPDFVGWFRDHYEAARAALDEGARAYQARTPDRYWQTVFGGTAEDEPL
jgi:hypothetical protein